MNMNPAFRNSHFKRRWLRIGQKLDAIETRVSNCVSVHESLRSADGRICTKSSPRHQIGRSQYQITAADHCAVAELKVSGLRKTEAAWRSEERRVGKEC